MYYLNCFSSLSYYDDPDVDVDDEDEDEDGKMIQGCLLLR